MRIHILDLFYLTTVVNVLSSLNIFCAEIVFNIKFSSEKIQDASFRILLGDWNIAIEDLEKKSTFF